MRQNKCWFRMGKTLAVLAMVLMLPTGAGAASKYNVLHRFTSKDGVVTNTSVFDAAGNLYGTTLKVVYKLAPNSHGSWTESVLYRFCSLKNCADGDAPTTLIFDAAGNLYGTTQLGGGFGDGTVFKLTPNSDGSWTESVLYSFTGGADGRQPLYGGVIFDATGNLYGTASGGGDLACNAPSGCGVVFKLTLNSHGSWTESVLYSFTGGADGQSPSDVGVIFDATGNLYGTASGGGDLACNAPSGCGVVFKLTPNSHGSWTESVLYSFTGGADGAYPASGLVFDSAGSLYGTTPSGGNLSDCINGCGVVFKLTPNSDGSWTESVLHSFANHPAANPYTGLVFDATGNLYGTTLYGGPVNGGVVFKMAAKSDGSWAYGLLHVFLGKPAKNPDGGLVLDKVGNLYGPTLGCGSGYKCQGVVFEITP